MKKLLRSTFGTLVVAAFLAITPPMYARGGHGGHRGHTLAAQLPKKLPPSAFQTLNGEDSSFNSLLFTYFVKGGGIGSLGTREVLLRSHRETYDRPVHRINPGVVLPGATAIFLRFPVGATNSETCG